MGFQYNYNFGEDFELNCHHLPHHSLYNSADYGSIAPKTLSLVVDVYYVEMSQVDVTPASLAIDSNLSGLVITGLAFVGCF